MSKNANSIDVFRMRTASMHAVPLMWMVFSGFFTWFAGLPLVPGIQDKFGLLQILLPGVLLAVCTIRTAAVRLTSFNITA